MSYHALREEQSFDKIPEQDKKSMNLVVSVLGVAHSSLYLRYIINELEHAHWMKLQEERAPKHPRSANPPSFNQTEEV